MPKTEIIQQIEFLSEFKNDIGFTANTGDTTANLTGLVMENTKTIQLIEIGWRSEILATDTSDPSTLTWTVSVSGSVVTVISTSADFVVDDGWSVTDRCNLTIVVLATGTFVFPNGTVTFISSNTMVILLDSAPPPLPILTDTVHIIIESLGFPKALEYSFGLVKNSENFNKTSKVSGNAQSFYAASDITGSFQTMIRLGNPLDWVTGTVKVRRVGPSGFNNIYEIEHEFTIVPWYLDGELNNLVNDILPPNFDNGESLKYSFKADFMNDFSNPNTKTTLIWDDTLGSVGWFDMNFNGFQNVYAIDSVTYEDFATTATASGIIIGAKTKIRITCSTTGTPFIAGERYGVYISQLPEELEYQNTNLTNLKSNFIYDRAIDSQGTGAIGQDFIQAISATIVSGKLIIECDVDYSTNQRNFLSGKFAQAPFGFVLGVQLGDNTKTNANSNRVMLKAPIVDYDESADISGLMDFNFFKFFPHDEDIVTTGGHTDLRAWVEDGFAIKFNFFLDLNKSAVIKSLEFNLVAHNVSNGQIIVLDTFPYNVASAVVSGGIQQINVNTNRGYNLVSGSQFNDVTLAIGSNAAGLQSYGGTFAQKISWQDWIPNATVDTIFFDATKPNDNFNLKASNYSALNGYGIKMEITASVDGVSPTGVSGTTPYQLLSPVLTVHDYDEDGNPTPDWVGTVETFHPVTAANLGGAVLMGLDTPFKITWANVSPPITSIANVYAIHRIEEALQLGYNIDELSSINTFPVPNRLIPTAAQTQLTVNIVGGEIITEGLTDNTQIIPGKKYNLSGRIKDIIIVEGKETEQGVLKDTEQGVQKVIE